MDRLGGSTTRLGRGRGRIRSKLADGGEFRPEKIVQERDDRSGNPLNQGVQRRQLFARKRDRCPILDRLWVLAPRRGFRKKGGLVRVVGPIRLPVRLRVGRAAGRQLC